MDLSAVERELKARWVRPYDWHGRKQNDADDARTDFIYQTRTWAELQARVAAARDIPDFEYFFDYAANRWYNFWSARAVETLFARSARVVPNRNQYDRLVDFTLDGTTFDHKTSVFPPLSKFPGGLAAARHEPEALLRWLYREQSAGRRYHTGNRLFLVLYDQLGQAWKLKAELELLARHIDAFLTAPTIRTLRLDNGREVRSALILVPH